MGDIDDVRNSYYAMFTLLYNVQTIVYIVQRVMRSVQIRVGEPCIGTGKQRIKVTYEK